MSRYIDAEKLIATLERQNVDKKVIQTLIRIIASIQQEPRFPQYDNIIDKVFGAGNFEGFEYREAEMLVALAKEELLKSLQHEQPKVELQAEQKPVDPSDNELQRHQNELHAFKVFATKQAREQHISFVHDFEWNNFCEGLLSYFKEKQKPGEWSKEDEKCIKDIIICLEYLKREDTERQWNGDRNVNPKRYDSMIAKLKSLRPQPKQKWTEEDEKYLNLAINIVASDFGEDSPTVSWLKCIKDRIQ